MVKKIKNYIYDKEFRIIVLTNKINIINYTTIKIINDDYISILYNDKLLIIKGNNLILTKILNEELLIEGNISKIEMG